MTQITGVEVSARKHSVHPRWF